MLRFSEDLRSKELLTLSQSLASDQGGVRVRIRGDHATVDDGPFAAARWATIEVRELGPCFT